MENTNVLDLVAGGLAIAILIGGYLLMFTTILTTKKNKQPTSLTASGFRASITLLQKERFMPALTKLREQEQPPTQQFLVLKDKMAQM